MILAKCKRKYNFQNYLVHIRQLIWIAEENILRSKIFMVLIYIFSIWPKRSLDCAKCFFPNRINLKRPLLMLLPLRYYWWCFKCQIVCLNSWLWSCMVDSASPLPSLSFPVLVICNRVISGLNKVLGHTMWMERSGRPSYRKIELFKWP